LNIFSAQGTHEKIGVELGRRLSGAITHNVAHREHSAKLMEIEEMETSRFVRQYAASLSKNSLRLMEGLSMGSKVPYDSILNYNALQDVLSPEGCTIFAAVGKATSDGNAILLKNRDVSGKETYDGTGYYQNREINITLVLKTDDENVMVGVTSAGSTGFMMGLNKYGVATASNFGQTKAVSHVPPGQLYGLSGRTQMMREALECGSLQDSLNLVLGRLNNSPMGTPGILWFVDAKNIYVIEGSPGQYAVQHVTDGTVVRSNHFLLLDHLNDDQNISSICRKIRGNQLVDENYGRINKEKMTAFSADHNNGPGANSICLHSHNPFESATVSAAIMEMNGENPERSKISIALGSPCWAWQNKAGNFTFQMDEDIEKVPQKFLDGTAYKACIKSEPFEDNLIK